jgi:hypothetical protein
MEMALSRQFKALGKITAFFAATWGAVGVATAAFTTGLTSSSLLAFGVAFASAGAISGMATALILARAESGRRVDDIPRWRAALWGVLGGGAPAAVFGTLALLVAGQPSAIVSVLGLGLLGGTIGGTISIAAHAAARRAKLPTQEPPPLRLGGQDTTTQ